MGGGGGGGGWGAKFIISAKMNSFSSDDEG